MKMAFLGFILFSFIFAETFTGVELQACGRRQIGFNFWVIDGEDATRGNWPWQVLLKFSWNNSPFCGGSLISRQWVVTAAHCVQRKHPNHIKITLGETDRNRREGSEVTVRVERIRIHAGWNRRTINNDIALIKLASSVNYNRYIQPVCLPAKAAPDGKSCYITGWGKMKHPGNMVPKLQQGKLNAISNSKCKRKNRNTVAITNAMICGANPPGTRTGGCHGDSGGPFVCKNGNRWELQGAVSWGDGRCNVNSKYSVFANIFYFKGWIMANSGLLFEGTYECHKYDEGGKNNWHYVTITYDPRKRKYTWRNRARRSWSLYPTSSLYNLRVGRDCPYYNFGNHRIARFTAEGVYGPWGELYTRK